jgi:indole-3-pyruvate monooxygenase
VGVEERREETTDTVVIGASAAGLATAACLRRAGVPFVVLEQTARVGSVWRNHYDRLHLHTPRGNSALPHLGFPAGTPRYPSRDQVVDYLERYAAHFQIAPRFGQRVLNIARQDGGGWAVRTEDRTFRARRVVVATGVNRVPHLPEWPGSDRFGGPILHSCLYRNADGWRGKRVLVVGMGNSGAEIALDLCDAGADTSLAVRGPVNVIPRDFLGLSIVVWAIVLSIFPVRVADAVGRLVRRLSFGPLAALGLRPLPHGPVQQIRQHHRYPVLDVGTVTRIRQRRIRVLPGLQSFAPGQVQFSDGQQLPFDAVVLATGYRAELGALLEPGLDLLQGQGDDGLPRASGHELQPGLYFCGFHPTETGGLRELGIEARRIARGIARSRAGELSPRPLATPPRSPAPLPAAAPTEAASSRTDR